MVWFAAGLISLSLYFVWFSLIRYLHGLRKEELDGYYSPLSIVQFLCIAMLSFVVGVSVLSNQTSTSGLSAILNVLSSLASFLLVIGIWQSALQISELSEMNRPQRKVSPFVAFLELAFLPIFSFVIARQVNLSDSDGNKNTIA
jgi:glucan phosphoethanolaminetransferase (alkaline phosphatase superfamily)